VSKAAKLLIEMVGCIDQAIEAAIARRDGQIWDDIGLLLIDTTCPFGRSVAEKLGDAFQWSDDGRVVTLVMPRARLERSLPDLEDKTKDVAQLTDQPGALVVCIAARDDVAAACHRRNAIAHFMLEVLWDTFDAQIDRAISNGVAAKWQDVGLIIINAADAYGRDLARAFTGGKQLPVQKDVLTLAVQKQALTSVMTSFEPLEEALADLDTRNDSALILSIGGRLDMVVMAKQRTVEPPSEADVAHAIQQGLAAGKFGSWDEAGLYLLDTRSEPNREIVKDLRPDWEPDEHPWVALIMEKRAVRQILAEQGAPEFLGKGALIVFHGQDGRIVVVFRPESTAH
jgi:hypothetical protein